MTNPDWKTDSITGAKVCARCRAPRDTHDIEAWSKYAERLVPQPGQASAQDYGKNGQHIYGGTACRQRTMRAEALRRGMVETEWSPEWERILSLAQVAINREMVI